MNNYEGTLIAVEGLDGAGTTTLVNKLQQHYSDDEEVIFTREPSERFYGNVIRRRLQIDNNPSGSDFFAFLADRCDHCENVIKPALEEGKTVITDRYALSTYAYQSKVLDEELGIINPVEYIDDLTYHFTIEPDLYIYLSIDVDTALSRIAADEKYEKRERLEEAKRIYDYVVQEKDNVKRISGKWNEEEIFEEVKKSMGHYND